MLCFPKNLASKDMLDPDYRYYINPEKLDYKMLSRTDKIALLDDESGDLHYAWREKQREVIYKQGVHTSGLYKTGFKNKLCSFIEGNTRKHLPLYEWNPKKLDPYYIELRGANGTQRNTCKIAHACVQVISH